MYFRFDVRGTGECRVVFELRLPQTFPQWAILLLKGPEGEREHSFRFHAQEEGQDLFVAELNLCQPVEYALRVTTPGESCWITPKGEEHDHRPHNWFRYESQGSLPAPRRTPHVDPAAFSTPAWVHDAVVYEIFVDRFARGEPAQDHPRLQPWSTPPSHSNFTGGNLRGVMGRLAYLTDLGVTAIYFTPIFKSPTNHRYDIMDYYQVDPHVGDLEVLQELVEACHRRGIRVILDGVFNHCSEQHPFFVDVRRNGPLSRYWHWFNIHRWPIPDSFGRRGDALHWYDCWWGFGGMPELNYHSPEVERYFLEVASYWIREAGVDGWRLDVPNEIIGSFWPKFRRVVKAANPDAYIVGEIWDDPSDWLRGDRFDAVMNYQFRRLLLECFAEERVDIGALGRHLQNLLERHPEPANFAMLNVLASHDTERPMTLALRSGGRRALESLKLMTILQFTWPGAPCIFYGDEIGLEGDKDPDCRRCYPWGWEQGKGEHQRSTQVLEHYRRLIFIRAANPALRTGNFRQLAADSGRHLYVFERRCVENHCIVALNRGDCDQIFSLPLQVNGTELLRGEPVVGGRLVIPARQAAIVRV